MYVCVKTTAVVRSQFSPAILTPCLPPESDCSGHPHIPAPQATLLPSTGTASKRAGSWILPPNTTQPSCVGQGGALNVLQCEDSRQGLRERMDNSHKQIIHSTQRVQPLLCCPLSHCGKRSVVCTHKEAPPHPCFLFSTRERERERERSALLTEDDTFVLKSSVQLTHSVQHCFSLVTPLLHQELSGSHDQKGNAVGREDHVGLLAHWAVLSKVCGFQQLEEERSRREAKESSRRAAVNHPSKECHSQAAWIIIHDTNFGEMFSDGRRDIPCSPFTRNSSMRSATLRSSQKKGHS